jgi:hypothetical protein
VLEMGAKAGGIQNPVIYLAQVQPWTSYAGAGARATLESRNMDFLFLNGNVAPQTLKAV